MSVERLKILRFLKTINEEEEKIITIIIEEAKNMILGLKMNKAYISND